MVVHITNSYTYLYYNGFSETFDPNSSSLTDQAYLKAKEDGFFEVKDNVYAFRNQNLKEELYFDCTGGTCYLRNKRRLKYPDGASKYALTGVLYTINVGVVAVAGCRSNSVRKRMGIWFWHKADYLSLANRNVKYELKDFAGNPITIPYPDIYSEQVNTRQITRTFDWVSAKIGVAIDPVTGERKPKAGFAKCIKLKTAITTHNISRRGASTSFELIYPGC